MIRKLLEPCSGMTEQEWTLREALLAQLAVEAGIPPDARPALERALIAAIENEYPQIGR